MRRLLHLCAFTLLGLAAKNAAAREVEASLGVTTQFATSPSMDAVATSPGIPFLDLGFAARLTRLRRGADLWGEARYAYGSTQAHDFQQIDAQHSLHLAQLGVRAVRPLAWRLNAFAHADVGVVGGTLDVRTGGATIADSALAASAYAGAGLDLRLLRASDPLRIPGNAALFLRIEGGYLLAGMLSYRARPDSPEDDVARLRAIATSLGGIDISGATLRVLLAGQF
jgi:hypothetical protein